MIPKLILNKDSVSANSEDQEKLNTVLCDIDNILQKNTNQVCRNNFNYIKVHDLTRGKYPEIYFPNDEWYHVEQLEKISHFSDGFQLQFAQSNDDIVKLLKNIPVFLVESSMADEYISVPSWQCSVRVPVDKYAAYGNMDFDIDEWIQSKVDRKEKKEDPRERTSKGFEISDLLGVYIYSNEHDVIPRRIFIWIDKIQDYAKKNQRSKDENYARELFEFVLYHEMAHALMDVELYGVYPAPNFYYANDFPYRFFEEAYANGIAMTILFSDKYIDSKMKSFIEKFVRDQGAGYSYGGVLYKNTNGISNDTISRWVGIKVLFNYEIAVLLRKWLQKEGIIK